MQNDKINMISIGLYMQLAYIFDSAQKHAPRAHAPANMYIDMHIQTH